MGNYYLMNKNRKVLNFSYDEETHSISKIISIIRPEYAPLGIQEYKTGITRKAFNDWWRDRAIPASRSNITDVLKSMGLTDSVELLEKCYGLSLSDQYWICPENYKIHWEDINFFDHEFSEDVGKVLMNEMHYSNNIDLLSPDNSSDGNLKKKWKIINGKRCLIKGGNSLNNQEPFNEAVATALYRRILKEGEYVPYSLIEENGNIYSCCETMVNTNEELVPALYIDRQQKLKGSDSLYEHYIRACEELKIPHARQEIDKMLVCDFILGNFDRHYRNFGAIRNVETLEWTRIAPIFDSGSSLYAITPDQNIGTLYKSKPFKTNPKEQLQLVQDLNWLDIKKLDGFTEELKSILSINPYLSKNRIQKIAETVENNIKIVKQLQVEKDLLKKGEIFVPKQTLIQKIDAFMQDVDAYEYQDQEVYEGYNVEYIKEDLDNGGKETRKYIQELIDEEMLTPEQEEEAKGLLKEIQEINRER